HRLGDIGAPDEIHGDLRAAFLRGGVHLLQPLHGAELLLERTRHEFFHLERSDAGVVHANVHRWLRDVRQQIDREPRQGDASQEDDDPAEHHHHHGPVNGKAGDAHLVLLNVGPETKEPLLLRAWRVAARPAATLSIAPGAAPATAAAAAPTASAAL